MIKYFIAAIALIIFFEFLGQSVNGFLKTKQLPFNFFTGFISYLGVLYILTMIGQRENYSFNFLLIANALLFLGCGVLIIRQRKNIKIRFTWYELLLIILMVFGALHYSWITTLGDLDAFDSLNYINQVIGAIGKDHINDFSVYYGNVENSYAVTVTYIFQSFFYFCSVVVYLFVKVANLLNIQTFYAPAYIWIFQIIFTFSLMSIFVNGIRCLLRKKYVLIVLLALLFVFHYGRLYWFSVYGFYGNSVRTIVFSYAILYLIDWLDGSENSKWLVTLGILAACACSSTSTYIAIFLIFGIVIVKSQEDNNLFKWLAVTMLFPFINLFTFFTNKMYPAIGCAVVVCAAMYFLNKYLLSLLRIKYLKIIIVSLVAILMFAMSYSVTHNIFDFSAFNDNLSGSYDMSLQYFKIDPVGYSKALKILTVTSLLVYISLYPKEKYSMLCWVLIICIFNPFCCSFINKILPVYYRSYEIFFNPFTLVYFMSLIDDKLRVVYFFYGIEILTIYFIFITTNFVYPNWHHASFVPSDDYDHINKLTNNQTDILLELDRLIEENNIDNPKIMTSNTLSFGMLGKGIFYLGRESIPPFNSWIDEGAYRVFAAYHPQEYFGQYTYDGINLMDGPEYLKESDTDILVLDRNLDYYNDIDGYWGRMEDLLNERIGFPNYHNDEYAIYVIKRD